MSIKNILLNTIIGDTLGRPFISMSSGHMRSILKNTETYIDPENALHNKLEQWVKPGLYSSISQLILLIGMSFTRKKFNKKKFIDIIKNIPEIAKRDSGILRSTTKLENIFISNIKNSSTLNKTPEISTSKVIPFIIPVSLMNKNEEICMYNSIEIITLFTKDLSVISSGTILSIVMHSMINNKNHSLDNIIALSIESCKNIINLINKKPENIFNLKINPESLLLDMHNYQVIFEKIQELKNTQDAGAEICSLVNSILKIDAKRPNLDVPMILLPYTFFLIKYYSQDHSSIFFNILREGGQTSTMLSIAGSLVACKHHIDEIPENLIKDLINKKKLTSILDKILIKDFSDKTITEFLESEKLLTIKEEEELKSKLKHYHKKTKKKKPDKEKNNELTKHVVESWTKIDQAKWKKQRKKL